MDANLEWWKISYPDDSMEEVPVSLNTPEKIRKLAEIAAATPPGAFVEIGVWRGGDSFSSV